MIMRKILTFVTLTLAGIVSGCHSPLLSVHKIDVQQGNAISQDAVDQLKVGMTDEQVRFLLGSPLVTDLFRSDRWDYVSYFKPGHGPLEERRLTVFFDDDRRVAKIEQPAVPQLARN